MDKICGIYKITNKTNGKYYIGSSADIGKRWNGHRSELCRDIHENSHLQRAWNKYGQSSFDFIILKSNVADANLLTEEQICLDNADKKLCYNMSFVAGKVEMTDEVKKKMSESKMGIKNPNYGKPMPEKMKEALKKSNVGRMLTNDHKQKISISMSGPNNLMRGKHHTDEIKKKLSEYRRNNPSKNFSTDIFSFVNDATKETFTGIKRDFIKKYQLSGAHVYAMILGKRQSHKGWKVMPNIP